MQLEETLKQTALAHALRKDLEERLLKLMGVCSAFNAQLTVDQDVRATNILRGRIDEVRRLVKALTPGPVEGPGIPEDASPQQ